MTAETGKARILGKWKRRHAMLQRKFEHALVEDCGDPKAAETIRAEMKALAAAIKRYSEARQGEYLRGR